MAREVSSLFGKTGNALEKQAYKIFGSQSEKFVQGQLGSIFNSKRPEVIDKYDARAIVKDVKQGVFDPTPYSALISSGIGGYDPKYKFLFKVKFDFDQMAIAATASSLGIDINDLGRNLTFTVKNIDLPKVDYEYQEVNMYNFKTQVLKSMSYQPLSMSFYDDKANHSLGFVNMFMMLNSPITRKKQEMDLALSDHGFAFGAGVYGLNTSNREALPGNVINIIKRMTIEQFYLERNGDLTKNPVDQVFVNSFVFTNPRIKTFDLSDQDHESGSEANMVTAQIDFDAIHIAPRTPAKDHVSPILAGNDIIDAAEDIPATLIRGSKTQAGKSRNPFVDILSRQGSRIAQTAISGALTRAGIDKFAGGALSGAGSAISGALGSQAGKTLEGTGKSFSEGLSTNLKSAKSFVSDRSTPSETPGWSTPSWVKSA